MKNRLIENGKSQIEKAALKHEHLAVKWAIANNDAAYIASKSMAEFFRQLKDCEKTCIKWAA